MTAHMSTQPPEIADRAARVVVAALFVVLAWRIGADFVRTMRVTGLLLLVSEALVAFLTVFRRRAVLVDRSWAPRLVAAVSFAGPPLMQPAASFALLPDSVAAMLSACGLLIVVAGKIALGRSFGIVPANRGVVSRGIYRFVRHPIYVGYLLTHGAFLLSHFEAWNVCVLVASDMMLLVRAIYEERTLRRDPAYVAYESRVRWRMVPGVF
jgi:protein-S-isoprenylcysteine O-methyltransferase Ste14